MVGEIIDSLLLFGAKDSDQLILLGRSYLLETQNPDGGWGVEDNDTYGYFHTIWTAIDGLRDYRWLRTVPYSQRRRRLVRLAGR
jgi:hypothetical protein